MTEPTDAELDELRQANSGKLNFVTFSEFRTIARAVLAKWGTPAVAGKPVAWLSPWRADQVTTDYDAYGEHGIPLYTAPQPSPVAQGNALDAEQHEMDARHAAIYRWMLSHVADVLSIFDNWLADEEADTDELHDALAARAAQEGKSHDN